MRLGLDFLNDKGCVMEAVTGTALPLGNREELSAKLPPKRLAKEGEPIRSVTPPWSGSVIKSHIPNPMASFPNPNKQTETEKPTSNPPSSAPEQSTRSSAEQAYAVKQAVAPAMLATVLGVENTIGVSGYRVYLDELIRDSGNPTDRVEIMLLEQIVVCHHISMQMQIYAKTAQGAESTEMYMVAGSRSSAEFRKTVMALKEYRKR